MTDGNIVTIYALTEPDDDEAVRYIGQTAFPVERRLDWHLAEARSLSTRPSRRTVWLRSHLARGTRPGVLILDTTDIAHANATERRCIQDYEARGYDLVNGTHMSHMRDALRLAARAGWDRRRRKPQSELVPLKVRLPRQLHERLTELAEARGLSLNTALILAAWDAVDSKPPTAGRPATPPRAPSAADAERSGGVAAPSPRTVAPPTHRGDSAPTH